MSSELAQETSPAAVLAAAGMQQYSSDFMRRERVILLAEDAAAAVIGVCSSVWPVDFLLHNQLSQYHSGKQLRFKTVDKLDMDHFLNHDDGGAAEGALVSEEDGSDDKARQSRISALVGSVLTKALSSGASDVHIEGYANYCCVRFRLDGVLEEAERFKASDFAFIARRIKMLAGLNELESRLPQDGRLSFNGVSMRLSIIPLAAGESLVLRLLNRESTLLSLNQLGFSGETVRFLQKMGQTPYGLFIITGPTGSGKTTTLASLLQSLDKTHKKIISLEDPVEYVIEGVSQLAINEDIELTFSSLLRRCLRQDPDILLIGEMRDKETAELAIRAALTGHLVLSTLHTNDAVSSVVRLKDMGIKPYLIASVLRAVMAQRLVRLLCPLCKRPLPRARTSALRNEYPFIGDDAEFYEAVGCPACRGTGYKGRSAVSEHFEVSQELERSMSRDGSSGELEAILLKNGYSVLPVQALQLAASGDTSLEEALRI